MTYEVLGEQTTSKKGFENAKYKRLKESSSPFLHSYMNRYIQATVFFGDNKQHVSNFKTHSQVTICVLDHFVLASGRKISR